MACAAPDQDEIDEFEQYRQRSYSAGAAMLERGPTGRRKMYRTGSARRNRGSNSEEKTLIERVSEMNISEDSGYGLSAEEGSRADMMRLSRRQRLERNRSFKCSAQQTHFRSLSCRRPTRPRDLDLSDCSPRMRTSSMPAKGHLKKPDPAKLRASYQTREMDDNYEFHRVRSFTTTPKGVVLNRGDSLKKTKHSSSHGSLDSAGSGPLGLRGRTSSNASQESGSTISETSPPDDPPIYNVLMLGSTGTGKSSITQQFMTSEYVGPDDNMGKLQSTYPAFCNLH